MLKVEIIDDFLFGQVSEPRKMEPKMSKSANTEPYWRSKEQKRDQFSEKAVQNSSLLTKLPIISVKKMSETFSKIFCVDER